MEGGVRRQLKYLGYTPKADGSAENGRIEIEGDVYDVARLNMFLRSGERVLIALSSFHAATLTNYTRVFIRSRGKIIFAATRGS